jgi:hypothetical protein
MEELEKEAERFCGGEGGLIEVTFNIACDVCVIPAPETIIVIV